MSSRNPNWFVCQIGAREHYILASELDRRGLLRRLLTDVWSPPGSSWKNVSLLARAVGANKVESAVAGRFCHDVPGACPSLARWISWQLRYKKSYRDELFADWAAQKLGQDLQNGRLSERAVVFSYSYGAYEIGHTAKTLGAVFVLGQIDGGPEEQALVRRISESHRIEYNDWRTSYYWDRWRKECKLADLIVVNSEWSLRLLAAANIDVGKCRVIPLAYEPPIAASPKVFPREFSPLRPLRALFLGQLTPRKGIVEMATALEALDRDPIELRAVGPLQAGFSLKIENSKNFKWAGNSPRNAVGEHYQWADVFVIPTHSDGFAITQLEAQSYGLPVIASKNCGRVVKHGVNGLLLDAVTPDSIRQALRWAVENPQRLAEMSESALSGLARFSPDAVVTELYNAVHDIE